jgi:hypothetical protein
MSFFHAIILITKFLYSCGIIYPKTPHICGKDTKKTPRHQINLGYILTFSVFPFREKQNVKTNKNSFKNITYHLEYQNLLLSLRGKY